MMDGKSLRCHRVDQGARSVKERTPDAALPRVPRAIAALLREQRPRGQTTAHLEWIPIPHAAAPSEVLPLPLMLDFFRARSNATPLSGNEHGRAYFSV